ncbi:Zn(II)2Cys6 cluster transcripitional activator [Plectosphaerella plurivora]|uniref:Zn(II)2Cys6 cluster transcripitional activator n=1 Tax=Plectosphaerella plurivora TaxID=936078 RepID=A0A9P8VKY5_9PEZI|nr:Zn(II)2Cys6 cluster transcripitional activator [Plectosphaerella plurivora]
MPRSSFSDNPLLRVSRPVSACSRCRAAKVKCDGKLPACTACEKAGRESECSSANDQFARGKERSYVAALELRIEKLEKRLAFARSRKASVNLHEADDIPAHFDRKDSLAKIRAAIHRKAARKREDSDINSLISDFGYFSVDATSRDFETDVSNMTFGKFVLAASTNEDIPTPQDETLPPRNESLAVVQYYMKNVYSMLPCFSQTKLFAALDDLYRQDRREIKEADYWLVYMVLAIGHVAQSRSRDDDHYKKAVDFVARALPFADGALAPGYVTQIQSLILFTQYSMLDPAHFDSWYLIGFAARAVIDLGFHQEASMRNITDTAALNSRQCVFYCVYSLDRSISMAHARAFSFSDDSIDVSYPTSSPGRRNSTTRRESVMPLAGLGLGPQDADPALNLFELRRKQSHWYQILFQSEPTPFDGAVTFTWQMCREMREWSESLPANLPAPIRELFDLELRYSYVLCLFPSARSPTLTDYTRALILEHVVSYMSIIHGATTRTDPATVGFFTYHDALKVFFLASQLVTLLNGDCEPLLAGAMPQLPYTRPGSIPAPPLPRRQLSSPPDNITRALTCLSQAIEVLHHYGQRWENALKFKEALESMSADTRQWLESKKQMYQQQPPQQRLQQSPQQHLQQSPQQYQQSPPQPQMPQYQHSPPQMQQRQQQYQMAPPPAPQQVNMQQVRGPSASPPMMQGQGGMGGQMGAQYQWYQ